MTHFKRLVAEMRVRFFFFFFSRIRTVRMRTRGPVLPTVRAHFLPFCEDTDCSIRTPKIASQENMTAAGTPGITIGHCGGEMPVGER